MALQYKDPCPKCGEQGRLRREKATHFPNCYVCTADDCAVVEYTGSGEIPHEAGSPEMKRAVLAERGYL